MRGFLRRFHRTPPLKPFRESGSATSSEESPPCSSGRHNRFNRSSRVVQKTLVPEITPVCESPETPTRSRKRDRLKNYLSRRRERKTKGDMPFLWPAMLSADKEEIQSSDDTEDDVYMVDFQSDTEDDIYMVDFQSDSDSDDDSLFEDDYVTPPVAIPEMYRRHDRQGGVTVAGARVLFTYAGFKRQQMMLNKLQSIPEDDQFSIPLGLHREHIVIGAY